MAILSNKIQEQIDKLEELSYEKKQSGETEEAFRLSEQAWALYPEPKNNWNEAYNSAKYIVDDYMEIGNLEKAKEWINRMIYVNNNLHNDDDELLFYIGKYYFEKGSYPDALQNFKEAVNGVGLRVFEDEDPKYLKFYKHPEKYIKQ